MCQVFSEFGLPQSQFPREFAQTDRPLTEPGQQLLPNRSVHRLQKPSGSNRRMTSTS